MGLLKYYVSFIFNLSSHLHPLNNLLGKETQWKWTPKCELAFRDAKEQLVSSQVVVHFDLTLPIVLAGDASAYGVRAVISHITLMDRSPLMDGKTQLLFLPEHCHVPNRTILKWRRRHCH